MESSELKVTGLQNFLFPQELVRIQTTCQVQEENCLIQQDISFYCCRFLFCLIAFLNPNISVVLFLVSLKLYLILTVLENVSSCLVLVKFSLVTYIEEGGEKYQVVSSQSVTVQLLTDNCYWLTKLYFSTQISQDLSEILVKLSQNQQVLKQKQNFCKPPPPFLSTDL